MLRFTKMHGLGNDYVYLDAVSCPAIAERNDLPALSRVMSDRHRGIGSDGLIVIATPTMASGVDPKRGVRMIMFNADGSRGKMCGNGIRCVCKYAVDHGLVDREANPLLVETDSGVLSLAYELNDDGRVAQVTVDMGEPQLDLPTIGVNAEHLRRADGGGDHRWIICADVDGTYVELEGLFVGMGNPHVMIFCYHERELRSLDLSRVGPRIEHHPAFVDRINVHFVHVVNRSEMTMRTWERGSGITQACGTGAAAVCVAGVLAGLTDRETLIHLPGGDLTLEWRESDNHVYKTGPAVEVFAGDWRT